MFDVHEKPIESESNTFPIIEEQENQTQQLNLSSHYATETSSHQCLHIDSNNECFWKWYRNQNK